MLKAIIYILSLISFTLIGIAMDGFNMPVWSGIVLGMGTFIGFIIGMSSDEI
jgi:hypothetical protein